MDNACTGGKIFLLFDRTHIIKNVYNNFQSKKLFQLPSLDPLVPDAITARFSDVESVHSNECHKPLKIVHKLTETVLRPSSIEKVNVKLAMALLHESTIHALKEYGFRETATVLKLFAKLWSVLNVATPTVGKHKRDVTRDPIRSTDDWKLQFLLELENYASFWKNSGVSYLLVLSVVLLVHYHCIDRFLVIGGLICNYIQKYEYIYIPLL